jgi:formate dehydrogenase subunit beta
MAIYKLKDEEALKGVLKNLLVSGVVEAVLCQTKAGSGTFTALVKDAEMIKDTEPLADLFTSNIATFLMHNGAKNIAVVAKPCEARAINELKKLNQIETENLVVISPDCLGTKDPKDGAEGEIRNACTVCEHFTPPEAEIQILSIGVGGGYLLVTDNEELIKGADLAEGQEPGGRDGEVEKIVKEHKAAKKKMVDACVAQLSDPDSLIETFKFCIRCDNCRDVCPICYCKECYFETALGDLKTDELVRQAGIKGAVRVPADILFYHLTRNIHVAPGCVECGSCEEACPREIPLLAVWKSITGDVQGLFEYISGMKREEPLPLTRFKESELEEG